ncbi:hypothetical protein [Kitasatospora azatica]|uniref:hypothetical protein n=1 Tax=Kitasatospora azatica TaxID=58347 RepID=UPI0007C640A9|nr:hypothetical protein [Kitasatospora azatica]
MSVPKVPSVPTVHQRAVITWLAVYPTITTALALIGPHTTHLPLFLRTLILTVVVVPVVVYGLIPLLLKARGAALTRSAKHGREQRDEAVAEPAGYSRSAVV